MGSIEILGVALALAMDAFAVSIAASLALPRISGRHLFRVGFHFGLFQALMPIIGWLAGQTVQQWLAAWDHWVAFGLLAIVGGRMIHEARQGDDALADRGDPTRGWVLLALAIATSIDALAVGISLAMLEVRIWLAALIIGLVACALSVMGMLLGRRIGRGWGPRVEMVGGIFLVLLGAKIVVEHLGLLGALGS